MLSTPVSYARIKKVQAAAITDAEDALATEEPLEIRLLHGPVHNRQQQNITVTMRTPGHDEELVAGFLFTEGMIHSAADITGIRFIDPDANVMQAALNEQVQPAVKPLQRNFYANSGCGVCGKADKESIFTPLPQQAAVAELPALPASLMLGLPDTLRRQQRLFDDTGGLHAAALFNRKGELLLLREDIGRHNAVDKVVGAALQAGLIPLHSHILLLSGRAGFELIQKAAMAGIRIIAAVGAPSSMAVKMAEEWDITLIGFLREQRFNIYTRADRITGS
jgi:FdhD protein